MPLLLDFENLVGCYYGDLYRFAIGLTRRQAEASDLVQETFYIWAAKGHQLRDPATVKSWLFTTLHREFLQTQRRQTRFPEYTLDEVEHELPHISVEMIDRLDSATLLECLAEMDERHRAPLTLYYLEDYSYLEIAGILEIPLGTVQSRIARGKAHLFEVLTHGKPIESREEVKHD